MDKITVIISIREMIAQHCCEAYDATVNRKLHAAGVPLKTHHYKDGVTHGSLHRAPVLLANGEKHHSDEQFVWLPTSDLPSTT